MTSGADSAAGWRKEIGKDFARPFASREGAIAAGATMLLAEDPRRNGRSSAARRDDLRGDASTRGLQLSTKEHSDVTPVRSDSTLGGMYSLTVCLRGGFAALGGVRKQARLCHSQRALHSCSRKTGGN